MCQRLFYRNSKNSALLINGMRVSRFGAKREKIFYSSIEQQSNSIFLI
ncbi:hypothetical protein GXM_00647 [Nostoc sphaeroides CCNUC1]|uniref:Uncharacterized protein n=1 Tax=Nostoc sphaeroides CCNUC1 TaxID=2653204 RepID=A0A5P8VS87_9NOSO|nr:hypothetical protein GXM_00647 [Nostoc sphaeroides CCNUC1]